MKIGIIGGGISGLTTALALDKVGIQSVIYEQTKELNEIGAGIWLQPNALKVLDWLGIEDKIKKQGIGLNKIELTNDKLVPYKKIENKIVQDESGNMTVAIHRARLQKILLDEVLKNGAIKFGKTYIDHKAKPGSINVKLHDGEEDTFDLLLAADGINSKVRQNIFPGSVKRSSGQVCWRGVSKMNLPDPLRKLGREAWGEQIRFGFSEIYDGEVYWFAVADEGQLERAELRGRKKYLAELFQGFSPIVTELVESTEESSIHQSILRDLKRLPRWYDGKVCLIGDAAHAATPNMGQGAGQGIEDAYCISKILSGSIEADEKIFDRFELKRRKKVDYIVNTSWQIGKMAHSKVGRSILRLLIKITPESIVNSRMNKLYSIEK